MNERHVQGICDYVAIVMNQMHGLDVNPLTDVAICCGQTEAFAAATFASILPYTPRIVLISFILCWHFFFFLNFWVHIYELFSSSVWTVIDKGDEVVLFDPCYETYEGCIKMAGGVPVSLYLFITSSIPLITHHFRQGVRTDCMSLYLLCQYIDRMSQVYVPLDPPHWTLDPNKFIKSFSGRTKAVILNRLEATKLYSFKPML